MTNDIKIAILRRRQRLLTERGPFNSHIIAKLERKIRALSQEE